MRMKPALWVLVITLPMWTAPGFATDDFGTVGIRFAQLYSDTQPNKRGPLIVLQVVEGQPAAKAGVAKGDIVFAIDGVPVMGQDLSEIKRKQIRGPIGSTVRLSFAHLDRDDSELTLTRAPYPPHVNPASDPFGYSVPGSWIMDARYTFPLDWARGIAHHGVEDLAFTPDFDDTDSPEYHSYFFFWWLDGTNTFTPRQLESEMLVYFRGLAEQRGHNYGFTPDPSRVSASYSADSTGSHSFGGVAASSFLGTVSIYDPHGKVITLNSEVLASVCPGSNHTAVFFGMSQEARPGTVWQGIDAVRDSFRCSR